VPAELGNRFGPDVQRHPAWLNRICLDHLHRWARLHLLCTNEIDRQDEPLAPLFLDLLGIVEGGLFDEAGAGRITLRSEQGVGHRSTDE